MTTSTQLNKACYKTPRLVEHGEVETLTQGGAGHFGRPVGGGKGHGYGYGHCKHAGLNPGHANDPLGFCS